MLSEYNSIHDNCLTCYAWEEAKYDSYGAPLNAYERCSNLYISRLSEPLDYHMLSFLSVSGLTIKNMKIRSLSEFSHNHNEFDKGSYFKFRITKHMSDYPNALSNYN